MVARPGSRPRVWYIRSMGHATKILVRWAVRIVVGSMVLGTVPWLDSEAAMPQFVDVTAEAGIDYVHGFQLGATDALTGGAAARDFDGDGWPDLVVTRFNDPPILYRNLGDGTFQDVTAGSGLSAMVSHSNGVAWGDIDNDGDPDLYITSVGFDQLSHLFVNDGNGVFSEEGVARGAAVDGPMFSRFGTSAAFGDYDRDGWLDLHVNEWGVGDVHPPTLRSEARLFKNLGATAPGTFADVTLAAGVYLDDQYATGPVLDPGSGVWSFASSFSDLDGDGHPDLVIASDFHTSRLYWNDGDGTFSNGTASSGFGTDENGMGLTIGDYDQDGRFDVFVTSIFHRDPENQGHNFGGNYGVTGNRMYRNLGGRQFEDATDDTGTREGGWGWGTTFADFDNDGHLDLMMTNGSEGPSSDFFTDRTTVWRNLGDGQFGDASTTWGITDTGLGRGLLTFDYDLDGDLDVYIVNAEAQPILYRNDGGNADSWLQLRLVGTSSNRDALGAIVSVVAAPGSMPQVREVRGGSNYLSQNDVVLHFGLGSHTGAIHEVDILWPSGHRQKINGLLTNQRQTVVEPDSTGIIDPGEGVWCRPTRNPFQPGGLFRFSVETAGRVQITIYDIAGRYVATLLDGDRGAGVHEVAWDGRDEAGTAVGAGVYLVHLTAGRSSASRKLVLLP